MLTDAELRNTKPGPKPQKLSDGHGLYLLVTPAGFMSWRYNYRHQEKQQTCVIGSYPAMSLKEARLAHRELREMVRQGVNPMAARQRAKLMPNGNTFEDVFEDWHALKSRTWKPAHAALVRQRVENDLLPHIGKQPLDEIDHMMLRAVLNKVLKRGATYLPGRLREYAGCVFEYGVNRQLCSHNPAYSLRKDYPHKVKHHPAVIDPMSVAELLRATWDYPGSIHTRMAFRLIALTGLRPGEIQRLEWRIIDFDGAEIRFDEMKMGGHHIVPLARQSLECLEALHELCGHGRYVFPKNGRASSDKTMSENTLAQGLKRLGYKDKQTAHGFRSIFCSLLNETGRFNADAIERQLAHQERNGVRAASLHAQFMPERRRMMQWWADYLDELRTGKQRRGKILKFPG